EALRDRLAWLRTDIPVTTYASEIQTLGPGVLADCRLVVGCVDSFSTRRWLAEVTTLLGLRYIDIALDCTGRSLYGRVAAFDSARGTACLACGWDEELWREIGEERPTGCVALAGREPGAPATLALPGLADALAGIGAIDTIRALVGFDEAVFGRELRL